MRSFLKYFLASLLALIVAGVIAGIFFFAMFSVAVSSLSTPSPTKTSNSGILMIDLGQSFPEIGHEDFASILSGGSKPVGLLEVLSAIEHAKTDNSIKGIYLKANASSNGMATLQELKNALEDFKTSGKFIYSYNDNITQSTYYVAAVSDSIFINPLGSVELSGLSSTITFFKGALDKLEVEPEIFYCGDFKSATEPFRLNKMSEPNRKQLAALQADFWDELITNIQKHRNIDTATINLLARTFAIRDAQDALENKLIDRLTYRDEVESMLKEMVNIDSDKDLSFTNIRDYAKQVNAGNNKDKIAVLVAEGQILDGEGTGALNEIAANKLIKEIRKVKQNKSIKAVVLRVNSPGGSAYASEEILRELQLLKAEKPLVVSMGEMAASGGYYIACQADSIFAMPNTITGSIGVFGMFFNTQKLMNNKLGITFDTEKNMPYADFMSGGRTMTTEERAIVQSYLDTTYHIFKSRISVGRKMDITRVDSVGQGRIWTGTDALQLGLVDGLGGVDRAVQSAATLAKLDKYSVRVYPNAVNQMEDFLNNLAGNKSDILKSQLNQAGFEEAYQTYQFLKGVQSNPKGVWAMMPYTIRFN